MITLVYYVALNKHKRGILGAYALPEDHTLLTLLGVIFDRDKLLFDRANISYGDLVIFKSLSRKPDEDLWRRAKINIAGQNACDNSKTVGDVFAEDDLSQNFVHIVVSTRERDYASPIARPRRRDNPFHDAVTFTVHRHPEDAVKPQWHTVDGRNDYAYGSALPPFIQAVVEQPRQAAPIDVDRETARHLFRCLDTMIGYNTAGAGSARLLQKVLSDSTDARPYSDRHPEMFHYIHALDYVQYQSKHLADGAVEGHRRFTIDQARSVVFEKFMSYWLREVRGAECTVGSRFPFFLIINELRGNGEYRRHCKYKPRPDVALLKYNFPRFLIEFDSSDNQEDKYRLHVQMACALRIARAFLKTDNIPDQGFFLMGAYFTKHRSIERYFCFANEEEKTCFNSKTFNMRDACDLTTFLFEFYNYARHVRDEDVLGNQRQKIKRFNAQVETDYTQSLATPGNQSRKRRRRDAGQDHADPSLGQDSSQTQSAAITDALQKAHFQVHKDEYTEEFEPLVKLPAHVVEATTPNGQVVVAKLVRKDSGSEEVSFLRELSLLKSRHNHVIPLLDTVQSSLGPLIILPRAVSLSLNMPPLLSRNIDFVQLGRELVEGVAFLHRQKIAHNDIKLDNLTYNVTVKCLYITDFGLAMRCKDANEMFEMSCGTPGWTAPEIVLDDSKPLRAFSPIKADLWACGNVLRLIAKVTHEEDRGIALLRVMLMDRHPGRRPLLDELIGEEDDFWTSGRLVEALNAPCRVDEAHQATVGSGTKSKRAHEDGSDADNETGPATKVLREDGHFTAQSLSLSSSSSRPSSFSSSDSSFDLAPSVSLDRVKGSLPPV